MERKEKLHHEKDVLKERMLSVRGRLRGKFTKRVRRLQRELRGDCEVNVREKTFNRKRALTHKAVWGK